MIGIYIRVSSARQANEGYSLQAQKERLSAYCIAQGWDNYKFYIEAGLSGKDTNRPVYNDLMADIGKGLITTVLVYKLDRIMRSISELDGMLKFFEENDCGFKSATEPFDTTNATGKLFMYIVGAFAQWEIDVSSERIVMVLEERVSQDGVWMGAAPYCFEKDKKTQKLVIVEDKAKTVLRLIDLYMKGNSASKVAEYLNATTNESNWTAGKVIRILSNPALCGHQIYKGKLFKNTHEGIISEDQYAKVKKILDDRKLSQFREVKTVSLFQQKLICPVCDKRMTQTRDRRKLKDGSVVFTPGYRCSACKTSNSRAFGPSEPTVLKALYQYMGRVHLEKIKPPKQKESNAYADELAAIENKRNKYQRAWASDLMSDEEFQKLMLETREVYEDLKVKVENYTPTKVLDVKEIKGIVSSFNANFKTLTQSEKRDFIMMFIDSIKFDTKPKGRTKEMFITDINFY